jgi:hypothetical protein
MNFRLTAFLILMSISCSVIAIGRSNLSMGYPMESCRKPMRPYKPDSFRRQVDIDIYNNEVSLYNAENSRFMQCVQDYLDNAANDIKAIQDRIDEAVENARKRPF